MLQSSAMSASALAIGVTVTSFTTGMTTDVCSYMFGSILAMSQEDVVLSVILSAAVLILFVFCYHNIFAVTFDESFSRATGVKVSFYNTMISVLTAVTIVLGMQMMGAMLISSLVIFPALSSIHICKLKFLVVFIPSNAPVSIKYEALALLEVTPSGKVIGLKLLSFFTVVPSKE